MSRSGRASGGAFKRKRKHHVEEEDEPAPQVTAHAEPLTLLAVAKSHLGMLVCAQLCNPQGVSLFSFVRLPPRVSRPFAGAPVHDMSLTHAERLCAVGCGFKGKLVRLFSLGVGRHFEPQRNWGACRKMMQSIVLRVAAGLVAAVRDKTAKEAEQLCASGQFAAALVPLQRAIDWGHLPSRALMAWLLIDGREGVPKDQQRGFQLAEEGARLGCHHCQGVMAYCYWCGYGCKRNEALSLELARESSGGGSRYGQLTLGELHHWGEGGLARDVAQAVAFYRLAAAQGLDRAQCELGSISYNDGGEDNTEALRWYQLAAAQGHPRAFLWVARFHEEGLGVAAVFAEAICWYRRAHAAGYFVAAAKLQQFGA